jgi:hypothetical protein
MPFCADVVDVGYHFGRGLPGHGVDEKQVAVLATDQGVRKCQERQGLESDGSLSNSSQD